MLLQVRQLLLFTSSIPLSKDCRQQKLFGKKKQGSRRKINRFKRSTNYDKQDRNRICGFSLTNFVEQLKKCRRSTLISNSNFSLIVDLESFISLIMDSKC